MFIKCKNSLNIEVIYQGKTGAICKTQSSIVKLPENILCGILYFFCNPEEKDMAFIYPIHKVDSCSMTAPDFKESINLVQNIVRGIEKESIFFKLFIKRFCLEVVSVFGDSEGTECAGINKNLHPEISP